MRLFQLCLMALTLMTSLVSAHPRSTVRNNHPRATSNSTSSRYVFAHLLVGITGNRLSAADWDGDMIRAKACGIDAFALNIGTNDFTDTQLGYAYTSAANNGMKVFLSIDFNWWSTGNAAAAGQKIAQYMNLPAQLIVDGKPFVSTFGGDGVDVTGLRNAVGTPIYFAPNFHPGWGTDLSLVDAALNWMAWPNNGNNRAPNPGQTGTVEAGDSQYMNALGSKDYLAPVSPWFFTHYGAEVSYSKNWLFPGDMLFYQRWTELLTLGPRFIEVISWNDYGESHYVGPLNSPHTDDGASKWINDMPHDAWLDMSKPFIAAFKAGATSVNNYVTSDQLIYWYRPQPMNTNCDATDTCMQPVNNPDYYIGPPNGWQTVTDNIFVISFLTSPATLQITSGSNGTQTLNAQAGASSFTIPMGVGQQKFKVVRNGQTVLSGTSLKDIINGCVCGLYNFNAYVGSLPDGASDPLRSNGYSVFSTGLRVSTCSATPSLGLATQAASTTTSSGAVTTTTSSTTTTPTISSTSTSASSTTTSSSSASTTSSTSSRGALRTSSSASTTASTTSSTTSTTPSTTPSTTSSSTTLSPTTTSSSTTKSTTSSSTTTPSTTTSSTTTSSSTTKPTTSSSTTTASTTTSSSTTKSTTASTTSSTTTSPKTSSTTPSTTTTSSTTLSKTTSSTTTTSSPVCTAGSGSGNYAGLCSFCCNYGYCPPGPCTCSGYGAQVPPPPETGVNGQPAAGLDSSYSGLCSYACDHGYCPSGACRAA